MTTITDRFVTMPSTLHHLLIGDEMSREWNFLQTLVFNFGYDLASNPTQYMMEQAFAHHGLNWRYVQFEFEPPKLDAAVRAMKELGFRGGNCTLPYKVAVIEHLDGLGESASLMEAVNCVVRRGEQFVGENTDGKGFLQSFREVADPNDKNIMLFGAGGAARAIAVELALAGAANVTVVNRSRERGEGLAQLITRRTKAESDYVAWAGDIKIPDDVDVVVNATSIGMSDSDARVAIDEQSLRSELIVADVIVNPPDTHLIRTARSRGCTTIDGLGMVVNQAVIAFNYWTDVEADSTVMRQALREVLGL